MTIKDKLVLAYRTKPMAVLLFGFVFCIIFVGILLMTINGFMNGALFGDEVRTQKVYLGENKFGKMYYYGDFDDGVPHGNGEFTVDGQPAVSMNGVFNRGVFQQGVLTIQTETEVLKLLGTFIDGKFSEGYALLENPNEYRIIQEGTFENNLLNGRGIQTFKIGDNDPIGLSGFFKDGELTYE